MVEVNKVDMDAPGSQEKQSKAFNDEAAQSAKFGTLADV
jgi:hypothetical protein